MMKTEKERRQRSAGRAFFWLGHQAQSDGVAWRVNDEIKESILDLLDEYLRLSRKERKQIEAGKKGAIHGKKGGRPRDVA